MYLDHVIVHGSFGSPFQNWAPWLHEVLRDRGSSVVVPHFPRDDLQNLSNWTKVMDGYSDLINENTCIVAHSLGPAFVVDWIVERQKKIKKFIAVAPFYDLIDIPEFDAVNKSFFVDKSYINKAKGLIESSTSVYSNNDPYVPTSFSEDFHNRISGDKIIIENGGHLNGEAGYNKFPQLSEIV